ncbi:homoserine kinase [Paramagnetospirillum kuznetsovii]|uniref:Homoserine kinase n=1 Tax=Paramagnetospirillum kuznetsovii TaxID=2053833 RepID=A0A364P2K1_9PROT|nr:homoserine kinase [Paramagnetospirillum kuznetsovii]RAU23325.1 homoserine kinase [Paramagnetospirillum kuznetsovii]
MAVYTEVSDDELDEFVAQYDIGAVVSCKGIAEGVENTNYLLQTDRDSFILTLYERRVNPAELPFFIGLMEHLAARGLACPSPIQGRDGAILRSLCGRPAALVSFLKGVWHRRISLNHCAELGPAMAEMHLKGADFPLTRRNNLSVEGWRGLFEAIRPRAGEIKEDLAERIAAELDFLEANWPKTLPVGLIHADLFPDNVFFLGDRLSGLIDFYFACTDFMAYDIAICLNAWCFEADGAFNATKARLMLNGYRRVRPLSAEELDALPLLARGAALRFLLTRSYDWLNTPAGAFVKRKDPMEYYRKLVFHQGVGGPGEYGIE